MRTDTTPDRSRDLSQPLDSLGPDETLKADSDHLRGTIEQSLVDEITASVADTDAKLMKFFGLYQQDDRDIRDERRRQKLEPAYAFMARVRLPGGVCSPSQWRKLNELARTYAGETLRLTTRQTFQLHRVAKQDLRPVMLGLRDVVLDTKAACGDDTRGVMCGVNPTLSRLHAQVFAAAKQASDHALHQTGAYAEIWYGEERRPASGPEEPFYGRTYLPRKFKIGFAVPPSNDIDVFSQDLGFIAVVNSKGSTGYVVTAGGGMGSTHGDPETYPRVADVLGFIAPADVIRVAEAVVTTQRDWGNRAVRKRARLKYTIDDHGLDAFRAEVEKRAGIAFAPAPAFAFDHNADRFGWSQGDDGRWHLALRILAGRIWDRDGLRHLSGLRAIATALGDRDVAMVFQSYALYPHMTIGENIGYPLMIRKVDVAQRAK